MERHYGKALFIVAGILLGCILIAYVLLPIFADRRYAYEAGYLKTLGITQTIVRYENLLQMIGEPDTILEAMPDDHPKGWWQAVYKEFSVLFAGKGPTSEMRCVIITGSKHRFGRNKIGIGSSMEAVKEAYENVYVSRDAPYTYFDDRMHVEFTYDENNVVCSIMITPYDLMM